MITAALGIIDKMRIEVFTKNDYSGSPKKTIFVQLNPEKFTKKQNVIFCEGQPMGTTGSDLKYNKTEGEEVNFEFLFDSSGVVPPGKIKDGGTTGSLSDTIGDITNAVKPAFVNPFAEVKTIEKDVDTFKDLLMGFDGNTHQTAYLKLLWGSYKLNCRLKNLEIEYTLFSKTGNPIRAKVKCLFKETIDYKTRVAKENKSSPDLTHQRTIAMNDSISLLAESIYESNDFYIDVAKWNKLLSFRNVDSGQKIKFPPVK